MNPSPESILSAVVLFLAIICYALFAGADFGAGIWDLFAGGTERGQRPRATIDASVTPVWEGNHVWIIFGLVVIWTAFPIAFASIMTALFVPLFLSVAGIFFRGIGFAFRHEAERLPSRRMWGAMFASASLVAPFFLGTVIGAVATGRVRAHSVGNDFAAWTNPVALVTGVLFVCACAYIGAVYLVGDAEHRGETDLVSYFSRRALAAGLATGVVAAINMYLMSTGAPYVFGRLVGPALPMVALSVAAGIATLGLLVLRRDTLLGIRRYNLLRITGALAVVSVIVAWGWAQYPWLLPGTLTLVDGSASSSALWALLAVALLAVVIVAPSLVYLYWLQQHERLVESEAADDLRRRLGLAEPRAVPVGPAEPPPPEHHGRLGLAIVGASVAIRLIRRLFRHGR
ncbi:cytochrome d ubiquinol oxidase subunit II [Amycolatopsis taiwanensis]|uniref:cytochrome d ubiquinol oxidase subunit II n=1 Tax=Amycolatopsis taiwanensis TaxID=342230 RepID=UPI002557300C|nr:cytochrome d ubiquinol oxidase subunit II [Amycolatopsis taiwanensis]